jgi:cyclase
MKVQEKFLRLIARLDIKGPNLIKGVHLEGLRVMGDPQDFASRYYKQGADELVYMDIVASLYNRSISPEIIRRAADNIFIPLTVGGGVRSIEDTRNLLRAGADKVAINTAAVRDPNLIYQVSREFGSQCMVLSIEAKSIGDGKWEVFTDCGRESTGIDALEWAKRGVDLGAGEVLVTSIDREGTNRGIDCELTKNMVEALPVPVIASGGYGHHKHLKEAFDTGADAIAFADVLHYGKSSISEIRQAARDFSISVRDFV